MGINAIWGPPRSAKTTLAIDLAYAFSRNNKSVCLISPEPYSELSARLNINIPIDHSLPAACKTVESVKQVVYKAEDLLYILAVSSFNDSFGEYISSEEAKSVLKEAGTLFDVVLVDCPSHCDNIVSAWALNMADKVVLLTGGQSSSYLWYTAFQRGVDEVKPRSLSVCSKLNANFDYVGLHKLIDISPSEWLPYFRGAEEYLNIKPTLYGAGGKIGKAYSTGINSIAEMLGGGMK